jgi:hypothetical protein
MYDIQQDSSLFAEGIYIESLHLTVPWDIRENELPKYGNPAVLKKNGHRFTIRWDSVIILHGIKASLVYSIHKESTDVSVIITPEDGKKLKAYLDSCSGFTGRKLGLSKKDAEGYLWFINGCGAKLIISEKYTSQLLLNKIRKKTDSSF